MVEKDSEQLIWVARQRGGLSNNLKCLLSAMRIAERDNAGVLTSSRDMASIFSNIGFIDPQKIQPSMQVFYDWRLAVFEDDPVPIGFGQRRESVGFPDADPDKRNIDLEYHRIPRAMRQVYLDLINKLEVRTDIKNEIESFTDAHFGPDIVAIHMRTWITDHWDKAPNRHQHYFNFAMYEQLAEQHQRLFVSSDNADYLNKLRQRFGDKILSYQPSDKFDFSEEAFINIALLSKSNCLYGSSLSSFTEMAWWLGGCKASVTLVGKERFESA